MIEKVISGGQTGVDQAGLRAAKALGIPTGGYAPRGWLVETGTAPWLAEEFGLVQCLMPVPLDIPYWQWLAACYSSRTKANVHASHVTLWLGSGDTPGYYCTANAARKAGKHFVIADERIGPARFADQWGSTLRGIINIAGSRESKAPGIGIQAESYLAEVFRIVLGTPRGGNLGGNEADPYRLR